MGLLNVGAKSLAAAIGDFERLGVKALKNRPQAVLGMKGQAESLETPYDANTQNEEQ
jgi:hypothetical protein